MEKSENRFPVVGIGASAGGLDAFKKVLAAIPESSGMAYVLVQHLDPSHESMLQELLQKVTTIPVEKVTDKIEIEPDHIYIIPSNKLMIANDGILELRPRPIKGKNGPNMPIDMFFRSLAEVHESLAVGVVLSGTASDGTLGLKAIKEKGGFTIAQDQESATYGDMPYNAVNAGVVDFVLSPQDIPIKILEVTQIIDGNSEEDSPEKEAAIIKQIISLIRVRMGTDFTYYKQTTIRRRILRRMVVNNIDQLPEYLKFLRQTKHEQESLFMDLLIPVTDFFRDPKIFDILKTTVFPRILENKTTDKPLRVWVAGCSTGQEAYSIAIALNELLGQRPSEENAKKIQIFATDLSGPAITKARSGIYDTNDVKGLSPEQLSRYFTKHNGGYQINKSIRESCVFAVHDFLREPPFGRMDFISCRNVLIYLGGYLQKKALTTFHYALNPKGILWLGKSEATTGARKLYTISDSKHKIFTRKDVHGHFIPATGGRPAPNLKFSGDASRTGKLDHDLERTANDILLSRFTPAGVIVNEAMDIVDFKGSTGRYLEPSPGKASLNLLKMAKDGLAFELRNILHKAKKQNRAVVKENISVKTNGDNVQTIGLEAIPLPNVPEPHYLILFHDREQQGETGSETGKKQNTETGTKGKSKKDKKDMRIMQLERELDQTREDMRSITEEQEAANEELQSANEELLSGSEELQSLNEEMESSREELQSANEELTVMNQEIMGLNEELVATRDYIEGILQTIHESLVVLDKNLTVKSANTAFYKSFLVKEKDTEGKLIFQLGNGQWDIPELRELLGNILPKKATFEGFEVRWNFPGIGERVMLLNAREIERSKVKEKLILLAIEDVTDKVNLREKEMAILGRFKNLLRQTPVPILILNGPQYIVDMANDSFLEMAEKNNDILGKPLFDLMPELKSTGIRDPLDKVMRSGVTYRGKETELRIFRKKKEEKGHFNFVINPVYDDQNTITGVIFIANEVTEQVLARKRVEESESNFRQMADLMPAKISNAGKDGELTYINKNWLDFTGLDYQKLKDVGFFSIMHPDDREEFDKRLQKAQESGSDLEMETRFLNKDGDYVWHTNITSPIRDEKGNFKMWIGVSTDISEQIKTRRRNLEIYKKHSNELEEQVAQRTSDLNDANAKLKSSNEELRITNHELEAFTYVASHDLQEPLRKIETFVSLILDNETQGISEKGLGYFRRIHNVSGQMRKLIDDLLDFSRLASGERKFVNTDLGTATQDILSEFEVTIAEKKAKVEVGDMIKIKVIPLQFHQLMHNLFSNALKFTRPVITPRISINSRIAMGKKFKNISLSPQKKYGLIVVEDNGIGFKAEYGDQIFEVFKRLHGKSAYPGTGIGLAVVKRIVENHGGKIRVESSLGQGSRFEIYIPVNHHN